MAALQWVAANLLTGNIIADLPGIYLPQPVARTIGQVESTSLVLTVDAKTDPSWETATQEGGAALIAWTGNPSAPTVVWGGIVMQRQRDPNSPEVNLAVSTLEQYLDGCQIDQTYDASGGLNQDTIVQGLMAFAMGSGRPPWILDHLTNASTQTQAVKYDASTQTTVLSALQSLSAVTGGPEWTCDWSWNAAAGTIKPVIHYGARVGQPVNAGAMPNVTLEAKDMLPGSSYAEDFSPGLGANIVSAYGAANPNATSADVPYAVAQAVNTNGRPLWAFNYQPNNTVYDVNTLATYASQALTQMQDGSRILSTQIPNDLPGKTFGVDWQLGDDIGFSLTGPAFPTPVTGTSRCVGYQADLTTVTPILKGGDLS